MALLQRRIVNFISKPFFVPATLLVLAGISYGILIPLLGYYGDDWSMAWLAYRSHHLEIFFAGNRPPLAYYYIALTKILGPAPWHWHVYALIVHWLCAVVFWRLLSAIWPRRKDMAAAAAILLLLYPGFWLTSNAMTLNLAMLQLTLFLGSLLATLYSIRQPKRAVFWSLLALAGAFINLFVSEYWFFLELVRPALIWFELASQEPMLRRRAVRTLVRALPFLAVLAGFLVVRALNINGINGDHPMVLLSALQNNPGQALINLALEILKDFWTTVVLSFSNTITLPGLAGRTLPVWLLIIGLLVAAAVLGYVVFIRLAHQQENGLDKAVGTGLGYLAAGLACWLLAGPPIWLTGLAVSDDATSTRLSLPFMPGVCILVVGLASLAFTPRFKAGFFSILVAFSLVFQLLNGLVYVRQASLQQAFLWQLAQRMPSLAPGAQLLTGGMNFSENGENANSAMINWMYTPPQAASLDLQYYLYQYPKGLQTAMEAIKSPTPALLNKMIGVFTARYQVVLDYTPGTCLRVLDPLLDSNDFHINSRLREAALKIDFSAIQPLPAGVPGPVPPPEIFGNGPPPDNWCSAFERASLAAQLGDWAQVTQIGDTAFGRGFKPNMAKEIAVFIEGYAYQGNWSRVADLFAQAATYTSENHNNLCRLEARLVSKTQPSSARTQALAGVDCPAGP